MNIPSLWSLSSSVAATVTKLLPQSAPLPRPRLLSQTQPFRFNAAFVMTFQGDQMSEGRNRTIFGLKPQLFPHLLILLGVKIATIQHTFNP